MSWYSEAKAFSTLAPMGKAADDHFIGTKREIQYRGQHGLHLGVTELLEA